MILNQSGNDSGAGAVADAEIDVDAGAVTSLRPIGSSSRVKRKPITYNWYIFHSKPKRSDNMNNNSNDKTKKRAAAAQISRRITANRQNNSDCSSRKRRAHLDVYTDSSGNEDNDLIGPKYLSSRTRNNSSTRHQEKSPPRGPQGEGPMHEGLRPHRSKLLMQVQEDI